MRSKKNWNIFWKLIYLFVLLPLLSSCGKEEMLLGSWNLQTVLMNNEPLNDSLQFNVIPKYTYYTFSFANVLTVQTFALNGNITAPDGFYRLKDKSTLYMRFTLLHKHYDIDAKIKKLNRRELYLEYEYNSNTYFLKLYSRK